MSNNLLTVRQALFNELTALNDPALKENRQLLNDVIRHAGSVKDVCDSIIDTAKVEHNFMRMMERRLPFTDFMTDQVGQQVHTSEYYAKLALEKRSKAALRLAERNDGEET